MLCRDGNGRKVFPAKVKSERRMEVAYKNILLKNYKQPQHTEYKRKGKLGKGSKFVPNGFGHDVAIGLLHSVHRLR